MRRCSWIAGLATYFLTVTLFWFGPEGSVGWFFTLALALAAGVAALLFVESLFDWVERREGAAREEHSAHLAADAALKRQAATAAQDAEREARRLERVARNEKRERERIQRERRDGP